MGKPLDEISLFVVANVVGVINFDFTPHKYDLGNFQILFIPENGYAKREFVYIKGKLL